MIGFVKLGLSKLSNISISRLLILLTLADYCGSVMHGADQTDSIPSSWWCHQLALCFIVTYICNYLALNSNTLRQVLFVVRAGNSKLAKTCTV